jgi:hypothetical protein
MFDMALVVAPPCITGHLPADFVLFPSMMISCRHPATDRWALGEGRRY